MKTDNKNRNLLYHVALLFLLLFSLQVAVAQPSLQQKKDQLQNQMKKLQGEIKSIEAALKSNTAKKQKSLGEIQSLQAKIRSREKLIANMNSQIDGLDESIVQTQVDIQKKNAEIEKMKADYANMLRKSYENINLQTQLSYLLSSNSFSEAVRRYNYMLKVAEYRRNQALAIQNSVAELQVKKTELEGTKEQKVGMLEKQSDQKEELEKEKKEKDQAVASLLEREKKLKKQQEDKSKAAAQLNNRIKLIIEEEIRIARKKAEEAAKKNPGKTTEVPIKKGSTETMPLTPQEQALSNDFAANMGKLPWPVVKGHIVSQFGQHPHPVLKGVIIENNGIDIKTEKGADARAVFAGQVVSVFYLPTLHNCVMVKHGQYFTIYAGIETVTVKANDNVTTKQVLGKLYTDKAEDITKMHIEFWKGKDKMNPETWLAN